MTAPARSRQLPLDLSPQPSYARDAFLSAECNRRALGQVLDWRGWPGRRLVLSGPEASGKTHLANIWAADAGAAILPANRLEEADVATMAAGSLAVDDADGVAGRQRAEIALLHLHNAVLQAGGTLLLTARADPGRWALTLPDLASRIAAAPHVRLEPPDDALLAAVLVKLFDDRQLRVSPRLIDWLVRRIDRSLAAARGIVARLDAAALAAKGPVTREMAAKILDKPEDGAP